MHDLLSEAVRLPEDGAMVWDHITYAVFGEHYEVKGHNKVEWEQGPCFSSLEDSKVSLISRCLKIVWGFR